LATLLAVSDVGSGTAGIESAHKSHICTSSRRQWWNVADFELDLLAAGADEQDKDEEVVPLGAFQEEQMDTERPDSACVVGH
jgi:hypothetical protein